MLARNVPALSTREPGGSVGAEEIRGLLVGGAPGRWDPLAEALLHFAARREHIASTIRPALDKGTWVLCDRFTDSTMAYQGYAQGVGRETIERLEQTVLGDMRPALTIILDLPVEAGLHREQAAGGKDRYARFGIEFHRKVRDAFLDIAKREPKRCAVVDATRSIDVVAADVFRIVDQRLLHARKASAT